MGQTSGVNYRTYKKRQSGLPFYDFIKSGKAPRARPVACAGNGVGCVAGEAGAIAVVGGAAVVADERPDVGSNRAVAASVGDSDLVSGVLPGGEGRCWNACARFGDVVVAKSVPLIGGSSGSETSPGHMS